MMIIKKPSKMTKNAEGRMHAKVMPMPIHAINIPKGNFLHLIASHPSLSLSSAAFGAYNTVYERIKKGCRTEVLHPI